MSRVVLMILLAAAAATMRGQDGNTALDAIRLLPKGVEKRLARIEARDGMPWPQRWYLLIYEPTETRGLREFVITEGQIVAARSLSQFADRLDAADVIGAAAVKVDSDQAVAFAGQYALTNGLRLAMVNYELGRFGTPPVPAWRLTCLDPKGDQIGVLLIHATKGVVISHDGFEIAPPGATPVPAVKQVATQPKPTPSAIAPKPPAIVRPTATPSPGGLRSATPPPRAVPRATPAPTPKPSPADRIRRLFGA